MGETTPNGETTIIKFLKPGPCNVDTLLQSTESAFTVLSPWYKKKQSEQSLKQVTSQVDKYVKALSDSIAAAKQGFDVAGQAITFASLVERGIGTEAERMDYLLGMVYVAKKGHEYANDACTVFRDVRKTLQQVIEDARTSVPSSSSAQSTTAVQTIEELEALESVGIPILEEFETSVVVYGKWWNFMVLEGEVLESRAIKLDYSSFLVQATILDWNNLRQHYSEYTYKIGALQDRYPELQRSNSTQDEGIMNQISQFVRNKVLGRIPFNQP